MQYMHKICKICIMGWTLPSHCFFQIWLDSSDFSFVVSGARNPRRHEVHAAAQHSKKNYEHLILFSFPSLSIKQNFLAVDERNLMEFVKPAVSCSVECNRLLVCVRTQDLVRGLASGVSARSSEQMIVLTLWCGLQRHTGGLQRHQWTGGSKSV